MSFRTGLVLLLGLAGLAGCVTDTGRGGAWTPDDLERAVEVRDVPVPVVPDYASVAGANFELIPPDDPAVQAAMREFEETGRPPRIQKAGFLYLPYDGYQTNLYCKPTRVCRLELAVGETPVENGIFLGDSARWWYGVGVHGNGGARVFSILFKPLFSDEADAETCRYSTNMVVQTELRTYQLGLICNEALPYTRVVRWYYPQEVVRAWRVAADAARVEAEAELAPGDVLPALRLDALNIDDYEIEGDDVAWRPVRAFDDGTHVYLHMPEAMRSMEAPAVFVRAGDEELALVNYRAIGPYLMIDRLFQEAVLVAGKGSTQERVTVRYRPARKT